MNLYDKLHIKVSTFYLKFFEFSSILHDFLKFEEMEKFEKRITKLKITSLEALFQNILKLNLLASLRGTKLNDYSGNKLSSAEEWL